MKKKGQAAMEFLMTYGWAIVVVLAAIGALAYFGVLSPSKLLPDKTTFPSPIQNIDSSAVVSRTTNSVEVAFRNNKGVSVIIPGASGQVATEGNFTFSPAGGTVCATPNMSGTYNVGAGSVAIQATTPIPNGATMLLKWTCTGAATAAAGDKFKADITFSFINTETSQVLIESGTAEGKYQ